MAPIAIVFGTLLTVLGPALYFTSEAAEPSPTAFIPSGFGVVLILCGIIACNERFRMHAMHAAALVGLIGFAVPAFRVVRAMIDKGDAFVVDRPIGGQIAMSALCLVFVGLCVKSFIDVRVARKKRETEAGSAPTA